MKFFGSSARYLAGLQGSDVEDGGEEGEEEGEEEERIGQVEDEEEVARMWHKGILYTRASTHVGNSLILYHPEGKMDTVPIPGSIQSISKDNRLIVR